MRVPSGDHFTSEPCTSRRGREPSAFMIHTDDSHLSFILSTHRRPNAICDPSGDSCGADTSSQSRYCSSEMSLGFFCWAVTNAHGSVDSARTPITARTGRRTYRVVRIVTPEKGRLDSPSLAGPRQCTTV